MKIFYEWTWVGKVPEHVTFEFKSLGAGCGLPTCNENYIVLPLDTKIKTAKDLCNELIAKGIMSGSDYIVAWNTLTQTRYQPNNQTMLRSCQFMNNPLYNFNLEPGVPYLITVTNEGPWLQE